MIIIIMIIMMMMMMMMMMMIIIIIIIAIIITTEHIYKLHENDKKRLYSSRVLEEERGTFTPLVLTTSGDMSDECQRYNSRLAELLVVKKQESYASTIAWIRTRVSFAILRSALVCLRGSRSRRRTSPNIQETDLELEVSVACR